EVEGSTDAGLRLLGGSQKPGLLEKRSRLGQRQRERGGQALSINPGIAHGGQGGPEEGNIPILLAGLRRGDSPFQEVDNPSLKEPISRRDGFAQLLEEQLSCIRSLHPPQGGQARGSSSRSFLPDPLDQIELAFKSLEPVQSGMAGQFDGVQQQAQR